MNRDILEKMFDTEFSTIYMSEDTYLFNKGELIPINDRVKEYLFNTIIPEVINSIIPDRETGMTIGYEKGYYDTISRLEWNLESLYNINLD